MHSLTIDKFPEPIAQHLQVFLDNPDWTPDRILRSALALFLLQNGVSDRAVSKMYLESMFPNSQTTEGDVK